MTEAFRVHYTFYELCNREKETVGWLKLWIELIAKIERFFVVVKQQFVESKKREIIESNLRPWKLEFFHVSLLVVIGNRLIKYLSPSWKSRFGKKLQKKRRWMLYNFGEIWFPKSPSSNSFLFSHVSDRTSVLAFEVSNLDKAINIKFSLLH